MSSLEIALMVLLALMICMLFFSIVLMASNFFITYKVIKTNFIHQNNIAAYKNYIAAVAETVANDTEFLKSGLVNKMGSVDDPEYKQLNRDFIEFQNKLTAIFQSAMQLSQDENAAEG